MVEPKIGDHFYRVEVVTITDDCGTNDRGKRIFEAVGDFGVRFVSTMDGLIADTDENFAVLAKLHNGTIEAPWIPHVYLVSPHAHADRAVMRARYDAAVSAAGILMSQGIAVYSPIVHNHPIAEETALPRDWEFWAKMDLPILGVCSALYVLQLDGWERSVGVAAEIAFAEERGIPVRYVRYGPNDGTGDRLTFDGPRPIPGLDHAEP